MIVKFHARGAGRGSGPVDYLLGKDRARDGATLDRGDPDAIQDLIDSSPYAKKYTSGVLSFEESDLDRTTKDKIMSSFEKALLPGLDADQYSCLWVEHRDKGRLELNFVVPNVELLSGKRLQPYFEKADKPRINAWKIETAALASVAMMKSKSPDRMKLKSCTDFIKSQRSSYGGYSSTNSTVLALRALVQYAKFSKRIDESGTIEVYANGKKVKSLDYKKGHDKPIVIDGLAEYLKNGKNEVEVVYANTNTPLPYSVGVNYNTVLPKSSKNCVIGLTTKLSSKKIKVGETVRLTTELKNTTTDGQPMTIAIVGLPAGLSAQPWQLKELLDKEKVAYYEINKNFIVLYFHYFKASETRTVNLDLKADIPGKYKAVASSAYLYYGAEDKNWQHGVDVVVKE